MTRALGYLPDRAKRPDEKADWHYARMPLLPRGTLPPLEKLWRILDQGVIGSCVANAIAGAWLALQRVEGVASADLPSRLAIYRARALEGMLAYDSGLQIRDGFDWVRRVGVMREKHFPYTDGARWNVAPGPELDRFSIDQGEAHSGLQYARLYETGDALLEQLDAAEAARHPVVFGSQVSEQFCQNAFDASKPFDPTVGASAGLHCQVIIGRRVESDGSVSRLVANSWGTSWGLGGFWWMAEAAVQRLFDKHALLAVPEFSDA